MPNSAQVLFALAMAVWVIDVRFAPKPVALQVAPTQVACHSGPSAETPRGADLELVICAPRAK
ncbi:MAG TPA: hypothetical protein VFK05_35260 [Polyangiaceae bacterium]|nr:hypothetical protein [Polyangiaceae bacterium]